MFENTTGMFKNVDGILRIPNWCGILMFHNSSK